MRRRARVRERLGFTTSAHSFVKRFASRCASCCARRSQSKARTLYDVQASSSPHAPAPLRAGHQCSPLGVPRGRIVEVFGPESSGKTTLIYHVLAEAQKLGGVCAFIDAEHSMDPSYARATGVDTGELLVSQPDNGEQALEIADVLVRSG